MFDGFLSGMFGGIFGPAIVNGIKKYRYWTIFIFTTLGVHALTFVQDILDFGIGEAWSRVVRLTFTPVGIFVPLIIGLLAVACLYLCILISGLNGEKKK